MTIPDGFLNGFLTGTGLHQSLAIWSLAIWEGALELVDQVVDFF